MRRPDIKSLFKKFPLIFIMFILSATTLFFNDLKKLGSLEDFENYNLNADIDKLHLTLKTEGIRDFLFEKKFFKEKLIQLLDSKTLNQTIKKEINTVMVFMFPYDVKKNLMINDKPLKRMTLIEQFPNHLTAKTEYKLLVREAYLAHTGAYNQKLPIVHEKILNIYSDIAGISDLNINNKNNSDITDNN